MIDLKMLGFIRTLMILLHFAVEAVDTSEWHEGGGQTLLMKLTKSEPMSHYPGLATLIGLSALTP